ncbi:MAG: PBP1A family penicillin-binding protein [Actinobacteria bacterium]|nr:PBP1A family penicillin-binding protein [Actinomycetota bacterium]
MSWSRTKRARQRAQRRRRIHAVLVIGALIIIPIISMALGSLVAVGAILSEIPKLENKGEVQNWQTTKIYAADGTLLTNLYYEQDRIVVPLSAISSHLQHAVIAIEDERFYKHNGYDVEAILRAFFANLKSGHVVEGASTITQQYVKNTMISRDKTFDRKIKEAALAYQLEQKYTKDQILEKYLNTIYFGQSWYGVETASQYYFGKRAKDLTLSEAATLAGIIKSPNYYSPYLYPNRVKERRDQVVSNMLKLKYITPEQAREATATPVQMKPLSEPPTIAPFFVEYVKQGLIKKYGVNMVFKGGLRVYTTIDLKMQKYAEDAAWSILNRPTDPSASIVAVESQTGHIKVMVGGRDFAKSKYNLATSHNRQPGSSFKTFVFAAAIENGISPFKTYLSSPAVIPIAGSKPWKVSNYVEGSGGPPMTMREALVKSVNTVFARLIMDVGVGKVIETAKNMGIMGQINPNPAIALGGFRNGPSPLDMASAYSTLANGGKHCSPVAVTKITDSSGKVIEQHQPEPKQVISEATAYIVTDTLQDVIRRGTGTRARIGRPCAGKTGTAQKYWDAWFCGYTPDLAAAVWVGYPQGQIPMRRVHGIRVAGGTFPAQIWAKFMSQALRGKPQRGFSKPKGGITNVLVCTESGLLVSKYCPDVENKPFLSKNAPRQRCPLHTKPGIVEIPDVVGLPKKEAVARLERSHFGYSIFYKDEDRSTRGVVISQTPLGGEKARQGTVIKLVINAKPLSQKVKVPNLVGLTETQAEQQLSTLGLKVIDITATPYRRGRDKRNEVISQSPAPNTELQYSGAVTIYVNRKR